MKKIVVTLLILTVLIALGVGGYVYKLHALAVEGNELYALRCTQVNPELIGYKNAFLDMTTQLNDGEESDADILIQAFDAYNSGMQKYVEKEDQWMALNSAYINRWDFRLFQPWYLKEASQLQSQMYQGYRDDAYYLQQIVAQSGISDDLEAQLNDARERRNTYSQKYVDLLDSIATYDDWRLKIIAQPLPEECTLENTTIPETVGSIDW